MPIGKAIFTNFISAFLIVLLLGAGYLFLGQMGLIGGGSVTPGITTQISESPYQAVFLTNGQVYFGKVSNLNNQYVKFIEIYYLILQQPLQQQEQEPKPTPGYTLIKLGEELHGPMDEMMINRDQILFIEPLKPDSQVVKAIDDFKAREGQ